MDSIVNRTASADGDSALLRKPIIRYGLWTVQVLLALLFLFAGGAKLMMPAEALRGPVSLPIMFLRFIGVCEVLGALGLILPGLLRIRPALTPLAAAGLVIIMIGATVVNLISVGVAFALMTLIVGLLAALVAYARWQTLPQRLKESSNSAHSRHLPVATLP